MLCLSSQNLNNYLVYNLLCSCQYNSGAVCTVWLPWSAREWASPKFKPHSPRSFPDHHCPDYENITNHIQEERPRSTAPSLCTTPIIPDGDSGHAVAAGNERPRLAHVSIEVGMPVEVGGWREVPAHADENPAMLRAWRLNLLFLRHRHPDMRLTEIHITFRHRRIEFRRNVSASTYVGIRLGI